MAGKRAAGGGRRGNLPANTRSSISRIAPPPELVSEAARSMWRAQSKRLIERGIFEIEDGPLLLAYCNAFHWMLIADEQLLKETITTSTESGIKKHPAMNVRNDAVSQLARLGSLLGLDPLSRTRVSGPKKNNDVGEANEFSGF